MEYKKVATLYKDHTRLLKKMLGNAKIVSLLKANRSFEDVMWDQVGAIKFLENKLGSAAFIKTCPTKDKSKIIKKEELIEGDTIELKMKNILSVTKKIEATNFDSIESACDSLNYLNVYFKNTYKNDINDVIEEKAKVVETAQAEKITDEPKQNFSKTYDSGFAGGNPFMNQNFNMGAESYKEGYIFNVSQQRLNKEIVDGTFYKFKTKPKSIVILKKVLAIIFGVIGLLGFISAILFVSSSGLKWTSNGKETTLNLNDTIFQLIYSLFYLAIYIWIMFKFLKKENNENLKYSLPKFIIIVFAVLFTLQIVNYVASMQSWFQIINLIKQDTINNDITKINIFQSFVYILIAQAAVYGVAVIVGLIGLYLSPKVDNERIGLKIKEYMDEIRSQMN